MISLILVSMAAFMNAVMDTLENENFYNSIFRSWDSRFWYKRESWVYARRVLNYKIDGWHLCKSAMIMLIATAIVLYKTVFNTAIDFIVIGMIWNTVFEVSYSKILKR